MSARWLRDLVGLRLYTSSQRFRALASFCCLCVRHHLRVLLINSVCMSCARQLHFGCSCCKIAGHDAARFSLTHVFWQDCVHTESVFSAHHHCHRHIQQDSSVDTSPRESATAGRIGHLVPGKPKDCVSVLSVGLSSVQKKCIRLLLTPKSSDEICVQICARCQLLRWRWIRPTLWSDGS